MLSSQPANIVFWDLEYYVLIMQCCIFDIFNKNISSFGGNIRDKKKSQLDLLNFSSALDSLQLSVSWSSALKSPIFIPHKTSLHKMESNRWQQWTAGFSYLLYWFRWHQEDTSTALLASIWLNQKMTIFNKTSVI